MRETAAAIVGFDARTALRRDAKRRIALRARDFIESHQTIIFDAGTTVMNLAQVMPPVENLTVYTRGLPPLNTFSIWMAWRFDFWAAVLMISGWKPWGRRKNRASKA